MVAAYRVQLEAYSEAIRQKLDAQAGNIIDEAAKLIAERAARTGSSWISNNCATVFRKVWIRTKDEVPEVKLVFKDVTYEQTKSPEFREKVERPCQPPSASSWATGTMTSMRPKQQTAN